MSRRERGAEGHVGAFVALDLDDALRGRLAALKSSLEARLQGLKWVRLEGIHLTLRFLGPSPPKALAQIVPELRAAAATCPHAAAPTTGLGIFPERGAPRVLWVGLELGDGVRSLQAACEDAAAAAGFARERRPFAPHLTLGRWRDRAPRPELPNVDLGPASLERLVLYRSDLSPHGATYTVLETFPLGGPP